MSTLIDQNDKKLISRDEQIENLNKLLPKFRIKSTRTIKTFNVLTSVPVYKEIQYPDENLIEFMNNGIFNLHIFKIGIHWYSLTA